MNKQHIILATLWIFYCILHSVLASPGLKQLLVKWPGKKFIFYRFFYTLFAAISLIAIIMYQASFSSPSLFRTNTALRITGGIITVGGLVIMLVSIKKYFMQASGLQWLFANTRSNELMITGIHRFVRHPLYLGTFIFIWGAWLIFPAMSLLISNSIITVYTLTGIQLEEKKLIKEFGEPYRQYRKNVPMLIPKF